MEYKLERLVNPYNRFEGAGLGPPTKEGFRVPAVENLAVSRQENKLGGSLITLTFNEEKTPNKTLYYIMAYTGSDVFNWAGQNVKDNTLNRLQSIQGPYIVFGSPATIFIQSEVAQPAYLTVTTRTPSGVVSELLSQPGVSVMVTPKGTYYQNYTASATIPFDKVGFTAFCNGTFTITLPDINQVIDGYTCTIKTTAAGTITINPAVSSQTIDGSASKSLATANYFHTYLADKTNGVWRIISAYLL